MQRVMAAATGPVAGVVFMGGFELFGRGIFAFITSRSCSRFGCSAIHSRASPSSLNGPAY
jgi:hypothetical protein